MSTILGNISAIATTTALQSTGNANSNGVPLDLQPYKGPVTFVLAVGQSTHGVGTLNVANIQESADNGNWSDVTGGAFSAVVNTANASNVGVQLKTFNARELERYVRVPTVISGTNANIPLSVLAIGQKERQ